MEYRFEGTHDKYGNIKALPTHKIEVYPDRLKRFNTKKSQVFSIWNDLFHPDVSDSFQYMVYREMILNKQNTYLILTKRPAIMEKFFSPETCFTLPSFEGIWHGLTVCNQQEADEKIPIFLRVPGKKFLSIEPMLGAIDLEIALTDGIPTEEQMESPNGLHFIRHGAPRVDAVILGGETGPGARPLYPDWVRSVRDQCSEAGVPFFFKGWGKTWQILPEVNFSKELKRSLDGRTYDDLPWVNNA
jgi:protein gp37